MLPLTGIRVVACENGLAGPLATRLLAGEFREGDTIRVDVANGKLVFERVEAAEPAVV